MPQGYIPWKFWDSLCLLGMLEIFRVYQRWNFPSFVPSEQRHAANSSIVASSEHLSAGDSRMIDPSEHGHAGDSKVFVLMASRHSNLGL